MALNLKNKEFSIKNGVLEKYKGKDGNAVIPEGVTVIGYMAFEDCTSLTSVTIPNSVTKIGSRAFYGCEGLSGVTISDNVTKIGSEAFYRCTGLTSVTIPEGVTEIGEKAFFRCKSLTSVTIPKSVTKIDDFAFTDTPFIDKLINEGNGYAVINNILIKYSGSGDKAIIPEGVTKINKNVFEGCTNLTSVNIPDSVTEISWGAFYGCTGLKSVTIPDSVTEISWRAFYGCTGLTNVTIPESVTVMGSDSFSGTPFIDKLADEGNGYAVINNILVKYSGNGDKAVIPEGVKKINNSVFERRTNLTSVIIPDSVTEISWGAFSRCTGLTSVTIPDSVTEIDHIAFSCCESLTSIPVLKGVTEISNSTFSFCTGLTSVTIPENIKKIGDSAFYGCERLTSVTIPDSVTDISKNAFDSCPNLKEFHCNTNLLNIFGSDNKINFSLGFLTDMKKYSNEEKETYIKYIKRQHKKVIETIIDRQDQPALLGVFSLGLITIKDIDAYIEKANSDKKTEILAMLMDYKNEKFTAAEVEKEETRKINKELNFNPLSVTELKKIWSTKEQPDGTLCVTSYKGNDTDIIIPECIGKKKITALGEMAFSPYKSNINNKEIREKISSIVIPEGVTKIGGGAFSHCLSLTSVNIPKSVESIGDKAFKNCENLTDILIPENVTEIGSKIPALDNGREIIASRIICAFTFAGCTSLKNIAIDPANKHYSAVETIILSADGKTLKRFFGNGQKDSCTVPEGVEKIEEYAFMCCDKLKTINIPASVSEIEQDAFFYIKSKITIKAPAGSYAEKYAKENKIKFKAV